MKMVNHPNRSKQQQPTHTPGPWTARNYGGIAAVIAVDAGSNICTSVGPSGITAHANARLIAAAPELLAALKAWQVFARAKPSENDISMGATIPIKEFNAAQELTRAAIAKAEGR